MYVCMYVSFGQGSSLLWTDTLRPFYSTVEPSVACPGLSPWSSCA